MSDFYVSSIAFDTLSGNPDISSGELWYNQNASRFEYSQDGSNRISIIDSNDLNSASGDLRIDIDQNAFDISTNGSNIGTNASDIAANTALINQASGNIVSQVPTDFYTQAEVQTISGDLRVDINQNASDISAHAARHNPGGLDALATGTPVSISSSNSEGTANSFSRSDHCFSADTELLTTEGFINYKDIKPGITNALTLNTEKDLLEYNLVENSYVYNDFDRIVKFSSKYGEILVTEGHRIYRLPTERQYGRKYTELTAKEALGVRKLFIPLNGKSDGKNYEKQNEFFELLGLIISEGNFCKKTSEDGNGIRIYQNKPNDDYIRKILNKLNIPYSEKTILQEKRKIEGTDYFSNECERVIFYLPAKYVKDNIYDWITKKRLSDKLMNLRNEQFMSLMRGLMFGDGAFTTSKKEYQDLNREEKLNAFSNFKKGCGFTFTYITGDKVLADQISHLCTLNNIKARTTFKNVGVGNGCWVISLSDQDRAYYGPNSKEIVPHTGNVWCATVENKSLVVRRNGFIFILGNTHSHDNQAGGTLHSAATTSVAGFLSAADKTTYDNHVANTSNPHSVTATQTSFTPNGDIAASNVQSAIQEVRDDTDTKLSGKQDLDATLTALAGYNTNGILTQVSADTFTGRTITAGSSKISVSDGDGVSNNPAIDVVEANFTLNNIGGTLGITKGGTGQTTANAAFNALAPTTTKGDLIVRNSTVNTRLPVGTSGQIIIADPGQTTGMRWANTNEVVNVGIDTQTIQGTLGSTTTSLTYVALPGVTLTTAGTGTKSYYVQFAGIFSSNKNNKSISVRMTQNGTPLTVTERSITAITSNSNLTAVTTTVRTGISSGTTFAIQWASDTTATTTYVTGSLNIFGVQS